MPKFRVCKSFTVESGHMLSKHPETCRHPHGHTRKFEVVVSSHRLDGLDMVIDFKALKRAVEDYIERFDHAMAVNSQDPLLPELQRLHGDRILVFDDEDPTTEVLARDVYFFVAHQLKEGFTVGKYTVPPASVTLERVRVWETPSSWAEYGD